MKLLLATLRPVLLAAALVTTVVVRGARRPEGDADAPELVLQEAVIQARVVGDEEPALKPAQGFVGNIGEGRGISHQPLLIPVSCSMNGGMRVPGLTSCCDSRTAPSASTSMMPISGMRSLVAVAPVVSRSTKARGQQALIGDRQIVCVAARKLLSRS